MPQKYIRDYFSNREVVDYYARATANIGLWVSEEKLFTHTFAKSDRILELGCGTGRIAVGLYELGYSHLIGTDLSREMIKRAQRIATVLEYNIPFHVMDATKLKFDDGLFDGAIFGFNGLMQIPGREKRRQALAEIRRVIRPGGAFIFTTHDRYSSQFRKYWKEEEERWAKKRQNPELLEFGDRIDVDEMGMLFVHVPTPEEVREDLMATGWKIDSDAPRNTIAQEPPSVREFADDCRFWVVRNPDPEADAAALLTGIPRDEEPDDGHVNYIYVSREEMEGNEAEDADFDPGDADDGFDDDEDYDDDLDSDDDEEDLIYDDEADPDDEAAEHDEDEECFDDEETEDDDGTLPSERL